MSILQEYEQIRRQIGERNFECINAFLSDHPEFYLSDVYYCPDVFNQMVEETGFDTSVLNKSRVMF